MMDSSLRDARYEKTDSAIPFPSTPSKDSANSPLPSQITGGVPANFLSPPVASGLPPVLPPRESEGESHAVSSNGGPPLPPRKRQPFLWGSSGRDRSTTLTSMSSGSAGFNAQRASFSSTANFDLLLSRLDAKDGQTSGSAASIASGEGSGAALNGTAQLRKQLESIRISLQAAGHPPPYSAELGSDPDDPATIDWEFWSLLVDDYATLARNNPIDLSLAIASGIPSKLRGVIWQTVAGSKSLSLEELYSSIVTESSPYEKEIRLDLSETNFVKNSNLENLFRVIKAYSLFDPEVGYTQGMAYIAVPLLVNMPELEAFCLLVKLMKDYGLRDFFLTQMPGLQLRLYQFDRILEDTLPDIHIHLSRQGVRSSMYTSKWFLTLFAYKFPLPIVLRIYDVILTEGIEALLKFAVGIMRRNAAEILKLDFDDLLAFLKDSVFDFYIIHEEGESKKLPAVRNLSMGATADESSGDINALLYRINDLVADAYDVKVLPLTLQKYKNEYQELHRVEKERIEEVEDLRSTNRKLAQRIKVLETSVESLTSEHVVIANELSQEQIKAAQLENEYDELTEAKQVLETEVHEKLDGLGENAAEEVSSFSGSYTRFCSKLVFTALLTLHKHSS